VGGLAESTPVHYHVSMSHERDSEDLRAALTRIDRQIAKLIDDRAALLAKPPPSGASLPPRDTTGTVNDDERPLPRFVRPAAIDGVLDAVRRACAEVGAPVRVAYPAAWSRDAWAGAVHKWGARAVAQETPTLDEAIDQVQRGHAEVALLPYVLADEGYHRPTVRALARAEARISECVAAPAERSAMARADAADAPHTIFVGAGERPFVDRWLASSSARIVEVHGAADACELASRDSGTWAVCALAVGERHGLLVRAASVANDPGRRVSLALVGGRPPTRTGRDAVALVLSPHETPGALADVLRELAEQRLNVAAIESMPLGLESQDSHVFLVIEGHVTDRAIVLAFERMRKLVRVLKVVGGYATA
jgi:prephenate dehydratase